jgi:putative hydrolase of the HAD superfamily
MTPAAASTPDWHAIDTVLLDLDGTLLDLAYDNYIWLGRLPELYAEANGLSVAEAQAVLAPKFRQWRGRMEWYSIEFWTAETGIDIEALHRAEASRVAWLPGATAFLGRVRALGKRLALMTDSHPAVLAIKHERTGVLDHLDAAYSSHRFGSPKQDPRFWPAARAVEQFNPARTLFVDDSPFVVQAATDAGIRWVYALRHADSSRGPLAHEHPTTVDRVGDLLPH